MFVAALKGGMGKAYWKDKGYNFVRGDPLFPLLLNPSRFMNMPLIPTEKK